MSHCSSLSGTNGQNYSTCAGKSSPAGGGGEIMLFGVRVKVDPMRKSVSLNNLSQYEQPLAKNSGNNEDPSKMADEGYASADDVVPHLCGAVRERKRGVPWTEEEHKLFLLGLQKVGKGDWRGISRNFVKTRTPTQVASHAQKYFLRRTNQNRRRRRSSLFDITTDSVSVLPTEESKKLQENPIPPFQVTPMPVKVGPFALPGQTEKPIGGPIFRAIPVVKQSNSSRTADFSLNQSSTMEASSTVSLTLSLSIDQRQSSPSSSTTRQYSTFQLMPSFSNGESIISVA